MTADTFPYLLPYVVSALISLGVAVYAWRRQVAGTRPFVVMVLSQAFWTFGYVLELISPSLVGKLVWDNVQFIVSMIWPLTFLAFVWQFSGRRWRRPRLAWGIFSLPLLFFAVLVMTDEWHNLVRPTSVLISGDPFDSLYYGFSPMVFIIAVYAYSLIAAGIYFLIRSFIHAHSLYRKQIALILVGVLVPIIGSLLTLADVTFSGQRDTTPFTFAISNLIIAWALYHYGLFDIVPVARDRLVESMSDLVLVLDNRSRFIYVNPAAQNVLGMAYGDVIGSPAKEVLSEWSYLLELLEDEAEKNVEVSVSYQNSLYDLTIKVTSLYDEKGVLNGRLIVARDISEIKTTERRLQDHAARLEAANEELRALSEVKDKFIANVSHELRTPLANLNLYHDLLLMKPERLLHYTEILQRETRRLERIIEDLLALSRLDQTKGEIKKQQTDLNDLVVNLVQDRQALAGKVGVQLKCQLEPDLPLTALNPSMITQVLSILVTNSLNYTSDGGEIAVITQLRQRPQQSWVGFCVEDTGYGISPIEQRQLFNRFFRGEASKKSGNAGTGLGLAIVKEIVGKHNGSIEVHSDGIPGQGTVVAIWLPVVGEPALLVPE